MRERKYAYKRPQGQQEHVEAIYDELSLISDPQRDQWRHTLKDYVESLASAAKKWEWSRREESEIRTHNEERFLLWMAALAIATFIASAANSGGIEWVNQHKFMIRLWSISLAAIFVGVSIERSAFFKMAWEFRFTKFIVSIALSALVLVSTSKASLLINQVFHVDASAFPFTRAIATGVIAFQYLFPLLALVSVLAILHAMALYNYLLQKLKNSERTAEPPWHSLAFLVLSLSLLSVSTGWMNDDFSEQMWPRKIYKLAHALDFNPTYSCRGMESGYAVIFVGSAQNRVLIDRPLRDENTIASFFDSRSSEHLVVPAKFDLLACEAPPPGTGAGR